eukprot:jgi/Ulvmu1/1331/UM011_0059.1
MLSSASTGSARHCFRSPWRRTCAIMADGGNRLMKRPRISAAMAVTRGAPTQIQGLFVTPLWLNVPLDWDKGDDSSQVKIFAREVISATRAVSSSAPYLCFFQGGPGCAGPIPDDGLAWLNLAVKHWRVILLDQRGTGRSTPVRASILPSKGSIQEQAAYLKYFRADSIVKDAETLRTHLTPDKKPWAILGQSFGGFCCVEYLSKYPSGVSECIMTGGIPPQINSACAADAVYSRTYQHVIKQNKKFYDRFPQDVEKVKQVVRHLMSLPGGGVTTPAGNWLCPRSLQILGMGALGGGGAGGGFERLHFIIDSALDETQGKPELMPAFLKAFDASIPFDTNPLYAVIHESCYTSGGATRWAAQRIRDTLFSKAFDPEGAANSERPFYFTGEMVFPSYFEDFASLRPFTEVAGLLHETEDWSSLYDSEQLQRNTVPTAAAVYVEDMYVDFNLSLETAAQIKGIRMWSTNEYQHSGIRDDGAVILERLLSMARGTLVNY